MVKKPQNLTVFCLDVGIGMQTPSSSSDGKTHLEKANEILSIMIQRRIFAESKDELSLLLFGSDETDNDLSQRLGGYDNISLIYNTKPYESTQLEYLANGLPKGSGSADFLDVITVALDIVHTEKKKKNYNICRIILLTNFLGYFDDDGLEGILKGFQLGTTQEGDDGVELVVISEEFEPENMEAFSNVDESSMMNKTSGETTKTKEQLKAESCISKIVEEGVVGACYSFDHALKAVCGFEKRSVNPAAWKCNLTISKQLSIPCVAYAKTKMATTKQSWKKCHAQTHKTTDIITESNYYTVEDGDEVSVHHSDIGKAYKYGMDLIPYSRDDEFQSKYVTEGKTLDIIAFTRSSLIPHHLYMGDQAHLVQGTDEQARGALATLVEALLTSDEEMCAIACYVYRKGTNPKLVALFPRSKENYAALVMVQLPFSEDVRPLSFPSLKKVETSKEQEDMIDELIDNMMLTNEETGEDLYAPKETINPHFQRTFQCLSHRMLNSRGELPDINDHIKSIFQQNQHIIKQCEGKIEQLIKLFPVGSSNVEKKSEKTNQLWKNMVLKSGSEEQQNESSEVKANLKIDEKVIKKIGLNTPKDDFICLIETAVRNQTSTTYVYEEMMVCIRELLNDVFAMKNSFKIIECLKIIVQSACKNSQVSRVNKFLQEVKSELKNSEKIEIWKNIFQQNSIGLISRDDDVEGATRGECDKFLSDDDVTTQQVDIVDEFMNDDDDADDLLDMLE